MNIQEQLFRTYNKVKYNSRHYAGLMEELNKKIENGHVATELDSETFYNATFYAGALYFGKIFLNIYQGDFNDKEVEFWQDKLDNPREEKVV
ncbi:MAG TPA: hypothetical protein ENH82_17525 [bacterium]|nr:hypothetical protein [bacterium]